MTGSIGAVQAPAATSKAAGKSTGKAKAAAPVGDARVGEKEKKADFFINFIQLSDAERIAALAIDHVRHAGLIALDDYRKGAKSGTADKARKAMRAGYAALGRLLAASIVAGDVTFAKVAEADAADDVAAIKAVADELVYDLPAEMIKALGISLTLHSFKPNEPQPQKARQP